MRVALALIFAQSTAQSTLESALKDATTKAVNVLHDQEQQDFLELLADPVLSARNGDLSTESLNATVSELPNPDGQFAHHQTRVAEQEHAAVEQHAANATEPEQARTQQQQEQEQEQHQKQQQQQQVYANRYAGSYMPDTKLDNLNSNNMSDAEREKVDEHFKKKYAASYMPNAKFQNLNYTNMTDAEREKVADYFKDKYVGSYMPETKLQNLNSNNMSDAEREKVDEHFKQKYAASYMPDTKFQNLNYTNMTDAEREKVADYFKQKYAGSYMPDTKFQNLNANNMSDAEREKVDEHFKEKYAASYMPDTKFQNLNYTNMTDAQREKVADYFKEKYAGSYMPDMKFQNQNSNNMKDADYMKTYAGTYLAEYAGDFNKYSKYSDNTGGSQGVQANSGYSKYMSQSTSGSGQAGGYEKYMQQNGGEQGDFPQFMKQGPNGATPVQGQNGGFQKYMSKYLPPGDANMYVNRWTALFSDTTSGYEEMHSSGTHGYNAYIDRYSAMAGAHPSAPENWQKKERDQKEGFQAGVANAIQSGDWQGGVATSAEHPVSSKDSIRAESPSGSKATIEQQTGALRQRVSTAGDAPGSSELAAQLPGAPLQQGLLGHRFFLVTLVGLCLPASFAFVKTLLRARRLVVEQHEGWQQLIDV